MIVTHVGNSKQVRVQSVEANRPQRQGYVLVGRRLRDVAEKADDVEGPKIVVLHRLPQPFGGDCLPVVHVALGRIVSKHAVDDNGHLAIIEPAFGPEPRLRLHGGGGHHEERCDTDLEKGKVSDTKKEKRHQRSSYNFGALTILQAAAFMKDITIYSQ